MKNVVLIELANRWIKDAEPTKQAGDGSHEKAIDIDQVREVDIEQTRAAAIRETKRECADTLIMLTQILGD